MKAFRGLLGSYGVPSALAALVVCTAMAAVLGASQVPAFQSGRTLPLWSLFPAVAASLALTGTTSRMPWLSAQVDPLRVVGDRLGLVALLSGTLATVGACLGWALAIEGLWIVPPVVFGLALGLSTALAAAGYLFCGLCFVGPVSLNFLFDSAQPVTWFAHEVGWSGTVLVLMLTVLGEVAFIVRGADRRGEARMAGDG